MNTKYVMWYGITVLVLCIFGFAAYALRGSKVVIPENVASDVPSHAIPGPSADSSNPIREERTPVHDVEGSGATRRVKLIDNDISRPLAGFILKAPSLGLVESGVDGIVRLHRDQNYRFSSPEYGKGVIRISGEGESPTLVRVRQLHAVYLTMSESVVTPADGLLVTFQYAGHYLPYVFQVSEYSARLRSGETVQLRLPRARWQVRAESGARMRPHVIDTSRGTEFELSLVNGSQRSIGGHVLTKSGGPCPGATVWVVGQVANATTDEDGRFLIRDCPPVLSLRVIPNDNGLEPLLRSGPFKVGRQDLVLTVQNARANVLTVKSRNVVLVPDAIKVHRGSIVTECPVSADGVVALPRMLSSGDAIEIHHSSLGSPVFCKEWTEECNDTAGERRYYVSLAERDVPIRIYDAGSQAPVSGCRVTLVSSPNGLVTGAPSGAAVDFTSGLRKSVVHGSYKADAEGVVVLRGVVSDCMYAVCRFGGYEDARVRLNSDEAALWVPLHRAIRIEGRVFIAPAVDGWPCGVRLTPADGGMSIEVLVKQGRFSMRVRSGRYRVSVRVGPSFSQLALIDRGLRDIYENETFDIDISDAQPVQLRFVSDPQCVRGAELGDFVTVQGGAGADPVIRVNNGSGVLEPVFVFPGEYYVWMSGLADDTGDRIVGGKLVRVYAGEQEVVVPIGFTGKKMLLRAAVPVAHAHETYVRLPDQSYVQLDAEGAVMLPQELPEGSPVQLVRKVGGKWVNLSEPMRLTLEGETSGYTIAGVSR